MAELIRLQKYLASKGVASRRKCEEFITDGLVKVNGIVVTELGTKVDPDKDVVVITFMFRIIFTEMMKLVVNFKIFHFICIVI